MHTRKAPVVLAEVVNGCKECNNADQRTSKGWRMHSGSASESTPERSVYTKAALNAYQVIPVFVKVFLV